MAKPKSVEVAVGKVQKEAVRVAVVGTSPLICNRMSEKARRELLLPAGRKNAAEKAARAKHVPVEEYQASPYRIDEEAAPTLLALVASSFKGAMRTAALDLPGTSKAQIGRLVYVEGELVPVYGEPFLFMSVTRSADINKTPDVRTRAILPKWAVALEISFVTPIVKPEAVLNLLVAAGITSGVGDWRPEKGKGDYGQFRVTTEDDPEFQEITAAGGREVQKKAMDEPKCYDAETQELLSWYDVEAKRRGFKAAG